MRPARDRPDPVGLSIIIDMFFFKKTHSRLVRGLDHYGASQNVVRSTPYPALGEAGTKGNPLGGDACHAIESRGHRGPGQGGWHVFGDFFSDV